MTSPNDSRRVRRCTSTACIFTYHVNGYDDTELAMGQALLYIAGGKGKREKLAQLVETLLTRKESASKCGASIHVALHPLVILRHVMGRNQRKNPA